MSKPLLNCSIADMENLRDAFLNALKTRCPEAASRLRQHHPTFKSYSDKEIFEASIDVAVAEHVIASEHGFSDWRELTQHLEGPPPPAPKRDGGGISPW